MGCSSSKGAAKVGPQGSYSQVPADSPSSGLLANADADAIENGDAAKENSSPVPAKLEKQPEAKPSSPPKAEDLELPVEEAPGSARDLLVPQKSMQKGPPWGRFAALHARLWDPTWAVPLCEKLFADAGVFGSVCEEGTNGCKDQFLVLTGIFGVGQTVAYGFSAPIGLFYDRWGAMIVGTFGALLCAVGLALVTSSVAGAAFGSDRITSYLFVLGVFVCDFGSMLNSFSFMGLIWHFPGKQTLVIALINATYQASALLPLILQGAMDSYSVPLYVYLSVWTLVVLGTVYVCYVMTPSQAEYYEQAKKVLGMPLPKRPPADLKVREMLGKAWDVLRQDTAQHIASGMALAFGFALPGYYASMTAPYGEALFGTKADGERLAEINVLCTSVVGLAVGPFSGSIADRFGLEVLIVLFAMLTGLATVTLPLPSWPAQILCASSLTFFISLFTIFISRYLLLYSPPNRFGAVQGVYVLVVILISTPWSLGGVAATALLGTGVNAYRIPMLVFGLTGVVSLSWYAWYFQKNPPPENPTLLPEDEAELAKGFGCGNLEEVMEVTHMSSRKELIRKLASTDPDVIVSLMKSIDTEKMMELSRRSVDDIADMMETVEEERKRRRKRLLLSLALRPALQLQMCLRSR
ncbi:unnamed protein product [Effrenium voratum]|nr:unnamed protein product [Effrenium voratum]